jgi:hypothetical protein
MLAVVEGLMKVRGSLHRRMDSGHEPRLPTPPSSELGRQPGRVRNCPGGPRAGPALQGASLYLKPVIGMAISRSIV